ncbi:MAG: hypothetical protein ACRDTQ_01705, partial [Micromonosporaceae bacterium]
RPHGRAADPRREAMVDSRERIGLPYGGAVEVARLDQAIHARGAYSRRCRACGEQFPCHTRQRADAALGDTPTATTPARRHSCTWRAVGAFAVVGLLLAAVGALAWRAVS